jgi:hypothetical protein
MTFDDSIASVHLPNKGQMASICKDVVDILIPQALPIFQQFS